MPLKRLTLVLFLGTIYAFFGGNLRAETGEQMVKSDGSMPGRLVDYSPLHEIDIYCIDERIPRMYRSGVTGNQVEEDFDYRMTIRQLEEYPELTKKLVTNLQTMAGVSTEVPKDFRIAIVGKDRAGHRIFSLYLNRLGFGRFNDLNVYCTSEFIGWLGQVAAQPKP
jgi:hypothetical protein